MVLLIGAATALIATINRFRARLTWRGDSIGGARIGMPDDRERIAARYKYLTINN
ncbi:hypothetical protein MTX26_17650 [Bradyrhizobium sp. ISRA443]|uniref:hypothetical protein n=1 Tax=unclassified Bradyrhizobium TaxID=2631580 RepID=UPI00247895DB|nr:MULTISPECIES: hypothetical protein [unclassified Bradyrhizobium]WGR92086.1 hypothetical protein MTX20_28260 [Bradyrhizobium sp. ISRA435]WGS02540.1 hypothetical protein MTX23_17660 [Bradyrhizobium sp. ISRA436]WGS09425.1 hypothetical protein MTX18_17650 [Bradyrhizobium sp. ISRA437]WGS16314.1 hypothetical protein MTX26_17650 [Bradyrhizobium sp. ISRA443]